jgi:broad specificity phosphatase PhoE
MKTVYFVRHGEAEINLKSSEAYGGSESPLTDHGKQQAQLIADRAAHLPVTVLISSTMKRTQQTAAFIAEATGLPIELSPLFVEREMPSLLVGQNKDDPETIETMKEWMRSSVEEGIRVLDGENFDDLQERGIQALSLLADHPEDNILVVTHGFFLRVLLGLAVFGGSFSAAHLKALRWGLRTTNTGLTVLRYDDNDDRQTGWHLLAWNDHSHLG